jgi:glycosyltransferase involved in cell wall biosynthesis
MAHNYYQNLGGEDISFEAEAKLLEKYGNIVIRYTRDNNEINTYRVSQKVQLIYNTIWSSRSFRDLNFILEKEKPELVHFQNTFPLISPSAIYACKQHNIPVVMSLRNYRLMCINGLFLRNMQICEDCIQKDFDLPGVFHACYRDSHLQSSIVALMTGYHHTKKTWVHNINKFICPSEFSKRKFIQGKLPAWKISVKPNFTENPGKLYEKQDYVLFIGRLSKEKGMINALHSMSDNPHIPFIIIGSGPLEEEVKKTSKALKNVNYLGRLKSEQTLDVLGKARFLIYPSSCYETFGRGIVEAFAFAVPVIASQIGALEELVNNNVTGLLIDPENSDELSTRIKWLWEHPGKCAQMGKNARNEYLQRFTPELNYHSLMNIYSSVMKCKK